MSVYVDDILLSHERDPKALVEAMRVLKESGARSGFAFGAINEAGPADVVEAFNIKVAFGSLCVTEPRMERSEAALLVGSELSQAGILAYVEAVNFDQAGGLTSLPG